jgi:hypothetical protein
MGTAIRFPGLDIWGLGPTLGKGWRDVRDGATGRRIDEPPRWMIFWPFDSKTTPPQDHTARTYIMLDGAPYGPLMIYHGPKGNCRTLRNGWSPNMGPN